MNINELKQNHDSTNEEYISAKFKLVSGVAKPDMEKWAQLADNRIDELNKTLALITDTDIMAMPSYVEVVDLFVSFFDDVILECALLTKRRAEIEKKILDLCKEALGTPTADATRDRDGEHITCSLIDALVFVEAPLPARASSLTAALMHDTNPLRLGFTLYKIFCDKYPNDINGGALQYLTAEEEVRLSLITSQNDAETADKLDALFKVPINNPERYILMSLYSFYNGFPKDASRALEIGLKAFPGNERLLGAQAGLAGL